MSCSQERDRENVRLKTVTGYAKEVPGNRQDGSDDEDDDDDNWLDYSQMKSAFSDGAFVRISRKIQYGRVQIMDYQNQKHTCNGRFVLTDPWWDMTVNIGPPPRNRVYGIIQYALRKDEDGIKQHKLVPMLIHKAFKQEMKDTMVVMNDFDEFIKRRGLQDTLTFENLPGILHMFASSSEKHKGTINSILKGETIQAVLRAHRHPELFRFLSCLFPLRFINCMLGPAESVLPKLAIAVNEEPWVFGFSAILGHRFRLYGVEANYKAFQAAGLMGDMPPAPKDALYIYEVLKRDASADGHTYISFPDLRNHRHWAQLGHVVSDWSAALAFLNQNMVTTEERFDSKRNIFLYHNWKAEEDIADGLKEILKRGIEAENPVWSVDFSSSDLDNLREDGDQWQAVQKVVASPVCILSGKGGCGKTTVVSKVIGHVCRQGSVVTKPKAEGENDLDDVLANAELVQLLEAQEKLDTRKEHCLDNSIDLHLAEKTTSSQQEPPEVSHEQLMQMIDTVTQSLEETQAAERPADKGKTKADQIQIDLTTDLIKYLGTAGDTALSRTAVGRKILLTAPTGKAAKLLGHKTKMESCTLHRVIYSYRAFMKAQQQAKREEERAKRRNGGNQESEEEEESQGSNLAGGAPKQDDLTKSKAGPTEKGADDSASEGTWKYAGIEVLVVDECSLVSLRLFATLIKILLENTPLRKVILLGDVRQLPSIEPGNFLADVYSKFQERGLSVELKTNHRSESDLIISNATRISHCQLPQIDPARHFHFCTVEDTRDSGDPERDAVVRQLLYNQPELRIQESSQFVAFRRSHCDAINELCCHHYNGHSLQCGKTKEGKHPYDFRVGDKICFRKNGQVLNLGLRLRGYLQNYPDILEAFGITRPRDEKSTEGRGAQLDVTAAVECIMGDRGEEELNRKAERRPAARHGGEDRLHHSPPGSVSQMNNEYSSQMTEFGIRMERSSQSTDPADPSILSALDGSVQPRRQLRLADIGAGENAGSCHVSSLEGVGDTASQPGPSQAKDDEEEQAGKLKNGQVRLCNGEVFFIMDDVKETDEQSVREHRYLTLSDRDPECPRVVCCSYATLKRECRVRHAWARTIHTYQGSESDTVVYYVGESKAQNWKHVYTAVTRGRKAVFIIGKESELRQAVWERDRPRRSRLSRRLNNMMKDLPFEKLHVMVRQINAQASTALQSPPTSPAPSAAAAPDVSIACTPADLQTKRCLIDSFPDSDDSWVKDMSPVWAAEYDVLKEEFTNRAAADEYSEDSRDELLKTSPELEGVKVSTSLEGKKETPCKRQLALEKKNTTPKRSRSTDAVDCIISPVRRTLNI